MKAEKSKKQDKTKKPKQQTSNKKPAVIDKANKDIKQKAKGRTIAIFVGVVATIALIIMAVVSLALSANNGLAAPPEGVSDNTRTTEEVPIWFEGELTNECKMISEIDENLLPTGGTEGIRDHITFGIDKEKYPYRVYDTAWCDVEIKGHYTADDYKDISIDLSTPDGVEYELEKGEDGNFTLKYRYKIYANLEGQPDGEAKELIISLFGKSKYSRKADDEGILHYILTVTTSLSEESKQFLNNWKTKIDQKIAEEQARKAAEEAAAKAKAAEETRKAEWARLTYAKFVNQIKNGMTIDQIQEIFNFKGQCSVSTSSGSYVSYSCNIPSNRKYDFIYAGFTFYKGKLTAKTQYGLS